MASIRARNDGRLFFDFRFNGARCRELSALDDTPANRRKMEAVLKRIEAEIALGTFDYRRYFPGSRMANHFAPQTQAPAADAMHLNRASQATLSRPPAPNFRDFVGQWLPQKQVEWRHSHRVTIDSTLKAHLLPYFGDMRVDLISRVDVLSFRTLLASKRIRMPSKQTDEDRTITPTTINKTVGVLRMILDEAALQHEFKNPCLGVKRLKTQRRDIEPFTLEEVQQILARVRPDYRPYLSFRFFTGVRSGEAHGLKWKHIDFARSQVLIRETFTYGRTEYTKNDGSQRELHMSQPVVDALTLMKPDGYDKAPTDFDDRYVFSTTGKSPLDNTNFNDRVWKPLLRNLGLKYRRPYQMRHTCATLWLAAGESPEWIARQLGHTTTEMLFRTYSRFVPNLMRKDGSAFDRLVGETLTRDAANDPRGITVGRGAAHG
jgi:integrase